MKILTYLGFTLISILIQFCVMDFIRSQIYGEQIGFNETTQRKRFNELIHNMNKRPHALYYRDIKSGHSSSKIYNNLTLTESTLEITTTNSPSTVFDLIYEDDNSTEATVTEIMFTSTQVINVTEFTLFDKKNSSINKPNIVPKKSVEDEKCVCNLLYKICDINCCCDNDCTPDEHKLFECEGNYCNAQENKYFCYAQSPFSMNRYLDDNELLYVVKSNLPERRRVYIQRYDTKSIENIKQRSFKWHNTVRNSIQRPFTKELYRKNDPVWLMRNGSLYDMAVPFPSMTNYCRGKTSIKFLKDESIRCIVKLKDLEMLQIVPVAQDMYIISATENTINSTAVNCSTVYCVNWTIVQCMDNICSNYNASLHEPTCTDNICTNIALSLDIIFYYYESRITKGTIKLYMATVSIVEHIFIQRIKVKFYMSNQTEEEMIRLSGNPGYLFGMPIIITNAEGNYTRMFYEPHQKRHLSYPTNKQGHCSSANFTKYVLFGVNKRMKCLFSVEEDNTAHNSSSSCELLQRKSRELLDLNNKISVSPYGNPETLADEDWVLLKDQKLEKIIFGVVKEDSQVTCYNFVTRYSFLFTYEDAGVEDTRKQNKILSAEVGLTTENITINTAEPAVVLTVDINFIDITNSPIYEYAKGPDLNIRLPTDFFFPFPSGRSPRLPNNIPFVCTAIVFSKIKCFY